MNDYRGFFLNLFDYHVSIKLSDSYAYVLEEGQFRKFYSHKQPPPVCAGRLTCTILELGDPPAAPAAGLSDAAEEWAYYPILRHEPARKMVAGRRLNGYDFVQPTRLALFDPEKLEMAACVCERSVEKNQQAIQAFFFLFASFLLAQRDGLLLHAYGLVVDGLACAIAGPSKAGKSTAGNLIKKDFVLSDDIVGITGIESWPCAHASPLASSGITDGPCRAPLSALFFPVKSEKFDVQPIRPRDAFLRYLEEHIDYVARLVKPVKTRYFDLAHTLFHKVPAYELHFPVDFIDMGIIKEVMSRPGVTKVR